MCIDSAILNEYKVIDSRVAWATRLHTAPKIWSICSIQLMGVSIIQWEELGIEVEKTGSDLVFATNLVCDLEQFTSLLCSSYSQILNFQREKKKNLFYLPRL